VEAHKSSDRFNTLCEGLIVKTSGRDPDYDQSVLEFAELVFSKGGIAEQVGYDVPPHILDFLTPQQMKLLVRLARYPVEHWKDGAVLSEEVENSGHIYEFVWNGCPSCRSQYEDTIPIAQLLLVMFH